MAVPKQRQTKKVVVGRVVLDVSPNAPVYYATHAEISHTPHDFGIGFGQIPARLSAAERLAAMQTSEVHIETLVQIMIPPTLMPELIEAMTKQLSAYEKTFGSIRRPADMTAKRVGKSNE